MRITVSSRGIREVIDALRRGTVPAHGLGPRTVGLTRFCRSIEAELDAAAGGWAVFKAVQAE